jgi:hypothetical protein
MLSWTIWGNGFTNEKLTKIRYTTGIRGFAECRTLYRVPFVGHSAKKTLPRAALGKVRLSVTSWFTERRTLGTGPHSAKTCLPSVWHSAKKALGKRPSAFAESQGLAIVKGSSLPSAKLPSAFYRHSAKHIFVFYILATKLFVVCSYTM